MKLRAHSIALVIVWLMVLTYGVYFSALSIQRHRAFLTNASDLGQIDQAIWNSAHGRLLEFTRRTGEASIRLTDHVEPIFVLISPVLLLHDNVEALLILQSFALGAGALAVFRIARRKFAALTDAANSAAGQAGAKSRAANEGGGWQAEFAAVLFAVMYLLFPALEAANLAEFHAVTFVPVFVLFLYDAGLQKKWGRFAALGLLTLMVKEEVSLLVFMLAGYFAISDFGLRISEWRKAPRVPLALAVLSLIWFGLTFFVIIPHFNALGHSPYTCRYGVGEDCPQVVRGLFLEQRLGYLAQLLASSGLVSLLDPVSLLLGAPLILANVVSNYPAQYSGTFHYSAPVVPYFVLGAIGGCAWLALKTQPRFGARSLSVIVGLAFAVAFIWHMLAGYTPIARAYNFPPITPRNELFRRFAEQIPPDAKVSTTPSLHPHLSHRRFLYRFPVVNDADYVLLDVNESDRGIPSEFRVAYNNLLKDNAFGVVDAADGYVLLKRGAPPRELPDEFFTLFRASGASPQYPARVDFDDKVRFLGYDVLTDAYGRGYLQTYWQKLKPLDTNLYLFPFLADQNGAPTADLNFPMTLLFWYPSASWQENEIVIGKTLPLEWGARAHLGIGVVNGFDWNDVSTRLRITVAEPATLKVQDGMWVDLGEFVQDGKKYVRVRQ